MKMIHKVVCRSSTLLLFFGFMGCQTGSQVPKTVHVAVCKYNMQSCHLTARNVCTSGYSQQSKGRVIKTGGPWGRYTEFRLRYTCD